MFGEGNFCFYVTISEFVLFKLLSTHCKACFIDSLVGVVNCDQDFGGFSRFLGFCVLEELVVVKSEKKQTLGS